MKKIIWLIILLIIAGGLFLYNKQQSSSVNNYKSCIRAGGLLGHDEESFCEINGNYYYPTHPKGTIN